MTEDDIINLVMRQTNYTKEIAKEKLIEYNQDHILVLKNYYGIVDKKKEITSINQEIYKQFRTKLNIMNSKLMN
jgi:hypothetical protein